MFSIKGSSLPFHFDHRLQDRLESVRNGRLVLGEAKAKLRLSIQEVEARSQSVLNM